MKTTREWEQIFLAANLLEIIDYKGFNDINLFTPISLEDFKKRAESTNCIYFQGSKAFYDYVHADN